MIVFALDTETTGLIENHTIPLEKQPEVIELYGCQVDLATGEQTFEVDWLFKPARPVTAEITRITGLSEDDLKDAPAFASKADKIDRIIREAPAVMAHNLSFDMEMLDLEFDRLGRRLAWPRIKLCTVEQTLHLRGKRLKLIQLHQLLFGEGFEQAHRARNDVNAMVRCAMELYKRKML